VGRARGGEAGVTRGLELEGVSRVFGSGDRRVEALAGVTLRLSLGSRVGVVGRNGAGKTTLLRLATGLLAPTAGRVLLTGRDLAEDPGVVRAAAGHLGPDERSFPPRLTPLEGLALYAGLRGMSRREALRRARERAEVLDAADLLDRPCQKLSSASASASRSCARCCTTRRWCCSTSRRTRSTRLPPAPCSSSRDAKPSAAPSSS
jgi:ABC-2 type transport system ATP-binding protein